MLKQHFNVLDSGGDNFINLLNSIHLKIHLKCLQVEHPKFSSEMLWGGCIKTPKMEVLLLLSAVIKRAFIL